MLNILVTEEDWAIDKPCDCRMCAVSQAINRELPEGKYYASTGYDAVAIHPIDINDMDKAIYGVPLPSEVTECIKLYDNGNAHLLKSLTFSLPISIENDIVTLDGALTIPDEN